jgi:hypothetical protein
MHIFVLTATYELRVSRKSRLRDHPSLLPETISISNSHLDLPASMGKKCIHWGKIQTNNLTHLKALEQNITKNSVDLSEK